MSILLLNVAKTLERRPHNPLYAGHRGLINTPPEQCKFGSYIANLGANLASFWQGVSRTPMTLLMHIILEVGKYYLWTLSTMKIAFTLTR